MLDLTKIRLLDSSSDKRLIKEIHKHISQNLKPFFLLGAHIFLKNNDPDKKGCRMRREEGGGVII